MRNVIISSGILLLGISSTLAVSPANAQSATQTYVVRGASAVDYAAAKPKPLPQVNLQSTAGEPLTAPAFSAAPGISFGTVGTGAMSPVRVAPAKADTGAQQNGGATPFDFGAAQLPFSTYRVNGYNATDTSNYPYRAAGVLYFNEGSAGYYCSASLIKKGIVVTAAHCVANFGTGQFYSNWQFIPAYDNGNAPYGTWNVKSATVLTSYLNGTNPCSQAGVVCQDDVAVLTLAPGGGGALPGTATGTLGYGYNGYSYAAGKTIVQIAQLGYPASLDGGNRMERNDAQGTINGSMVNNTVIGTLMTGGSSGGPWIVNFGQAPSNSGTFGSAPTRNAIVGVTSWGTTNATYKREGASAFTSGNIIVLLNAVCSANPGNC